jgi:hypothetical protein
MLANDKLGHIIVIRLWLEKFQNLDIGFVTRLRPRAVLAPAAYRKRKRRRAQPPDHSFREVVLAVSELCQNPIRFGH